MSRAVRRSIIDQSKRAHVGHIGSALSIADLLVALYSDVLDGGPDDPDRDRFVLSKGHAVLALYAVLRETGTLEQADLDEFCTEGTAMGAHPDHGVRGIDFSTGSLGQGLTFAAGAALAARMQGSGRRAFALISDAELNEGSVWEAAMFAAHHRLANLTAIVDVNGQQALGRTADVLDLARLDERWASFGWDVHEADGHDVEGLVELLRSLERHEGPPHVVLARTTFGSGVSYMEGQIPWHYWPMSDEQYAQALGEIDAS